MERLPLELWEIIFAHIDDLQLARLTRVAKLWNHNLSADIFWKKRTEEAFGPQQRVTQGKWKVRFGREYKALMYDTQRMKPPPVFPIRSLVLGEIFAAVVLTIWAVVLPNLALDFLSSPFPAVIAWVGMKGFKKAGVKIDRSVPRFLSLRTYVVSAFVVIQALLAWQLSPAACSTAVVTGYVLMCNAFLIEGITDSQAELRLLYMLAQWKLMASSSMLQVYLFLFSPLDYFSQQAFTRNLFLLATATKILKPVYLTGPVLPRLLKEQCFADGAQTEQAAISCASVQSGILVSLSNGATFIGAPIMGLMSDTLGRRAFLMVSAAALSLDLISLALAPTVGLLYITRPLFGFFNAGFAISTAYCADMVGPANRGRAFGILGVSFGIALACGPLLTGWMAKYFAVRVALLVVGIIAATNVALGFFLRETRPRTNPPARIAWDKAVPLRSFGLLRHSNVAMAFTAVFLLKYIADEGIIDTFPLYLDYKFSWSPLQVGVFASLLGLSLALAQGLLVPFLHLLYTERQAIILALILATVAGLMYAMANEGWQLYIIIVFRSISLISAPLLQAEIANEFSANTLGELLGLVTSLRNLSASFGPLMFNWLFAYFISDKAPVLIPNVVFYVSAACSMLATMLAVATVLRSKEPAAKASEERAPETVELTSVDANGGEGSDATL